MSSSIPFHKLDEGITLALANAHRLLGDAKLLFENSRYSSSRVLAILSWEESAKVAFLFECKTEDKNVTKTQWRKECTQHLKKLDKIQELMHTHSSPIFEEEMWESYFDWDYSKMIKERREKLTYVDYNFESEEWASPISSFVFGDDDEIDCIEAIRIAEESIAAVEEEMEWEEEAKS